MTDTVASVIYFVFMVVGEPAGARVDFAREDWMADSSERGDEVGAIAVMEEDPEALPVTEGLDLAEDEMALIDVPSRFPASSGVSH